MVGTYFYHQILRRTVIGFGTLFNNLEIRQKNDNGSEENRLKVPLAYGPMQKFLAKIDQNSDLRGRPAITLPRLSFEMTGINYDPTRKATVTQTFKSVTGSTPGNIKKVFMPVPYNIAFQLSIATKTNDDMLQIMEQILPYFQPALNITINLVDSIGEKRDVPIVIETINMSDDYEGNFDNRRAMITTITFTAKTYLFGAIADSPDGLIKKVQVDYYTDTDIVQARREVRYRATPRALKDYNNDSTSGLAKELTSKQTVLTVNNASGFTVDDYIVIGSENMQISSISGNTLTVYRGVDGTTVTDHASGSTINIISGTRTPDLPLTGDDALIPDGDDFGFNELTSFYQDYKEYSPSQGTDV
ncbi:tail sheath stabilizer [Synechococcus phage S-CAM9]|uniref:Tail sheath stabilizer n=1 Tax=Synechococcus phage S-CAM9 TaxID=1883369 RepID=A0A1D8KP77_9CAUD|nr:tail sheath stabilizer [Synechococcus phage S-CAM9]AOV60228.1 tail sheath stabilizer [Synechococcus phage S-CAM9]AOV60455.1 tail sheath stabilizer [Synechococcus phage S-CAM9]AOV60684.1 tail sheath stabilizer [Synechococcus phage S-CAM9]